MIYLISYFLFMPLTLQCLYQPNYCMSPDYTARTNLYKFFDDRAFHSSNEKEDAVYEYAKNYALQHGYKKIINVGCGTGRRFLHYFDNFTTVGYDVPEIVAFARQHNPNKEWRPCDFSKPLSDPINTPPTDEFDLLICNSVVHHLLDPHILMEWIQKIKCKKIIISTTDRHQLELKRGRMDFGPPISDFNVREWDFKEFKQFVRQFFRIEKQFHVNPRYNQVIICRNK